MTTILEKWTAERIPDQSGRLAIETAVPGAQLYTQSKLANLLFMLELDRRLRAGGSTTKSLGAHPG
jgi:hypothetical protein